jgi:hypothetical protein
MKNTLMMIIFKNYFHIIIKDFDTFEDNDKLHIKYLLDKKYEISLSKAIIRALLG